MFLRFTSRTNADGSVVRYVALAHNRRVDGRIKPDVLMNLGRVDQVDVEVAGDYLIYGAGTMGLLLAQLAKDAGAGQIDIVDTNSGRHALATRLGADHVATSATALDRPQGWDVVIDATARPDPARGG